MSELMVGAGKAKMNPPKEIFPIPHFGGVNFEGQKHDLYARAIFIDNGGVKFLFLSTDAGKEADDELKSEIGRRFNIDPDNILAVSTHNHSAPDWDGSGMMGTDPQEMKIKGLAFRKVVVSAIYSAVQQAIDGMRKARYGYKSGKSYININRDLKDEDGNWIQAPNFEGFSDKTLACVRFEDEQGKPIAFFLNYGCHANTAFCVKDIDGKEKVTPGFPGICCDFIERRYNDSVVCMWSSGAAGDQNVIFSSEGFPRRYETDGHSNAVATPPGTQYMLQEYFGQIHAIDALHVLEHMDCSETDMPIHIFTTSVNIDKQKFPENTDRFLVWVMANNAYEKYRPELLVDGKPPKKEFPVMEPDGTFPMEMKLIVLGNIALIGTGGEIYAKIGKKIKDASPMTNTIVVTHCGLGGGAYMASDDSADHNVFEYFGRARPGRIDETILKGEDVLFRAAGLKK